MHQECVAAGAAWNDVQLHQGTFLVGRQPGGHPRAWPPAGAVQLAYRLVGSSEIASNSESNRTTWDLRAAEL
eukprot:12936564-Prorocentrum_lima.AAC.1